MRRTENECVGCPPNLACLYRACPFYEVNRYYCDECNDETILYEFDGQELCIECIKKRLDVVEGSNAYEY